MLCINAIIIGYFLLVCLFIFELICLKCKHGYSLMSPSGEGQVLVIHGANYGRRDKTTCSAGRPASQLQVVQCSSQTSTNVVAERYRLAVFVYNSVFGDPCVGTYKYLEVDYTCQFQTVTCEESEANLQCGEILVIHRADYGRHDQTTCSNLQPHCRLRDVQCSSPESIEVIAARYAVCQTSADSLFISIQSCNGKNSCNISASNSVFGNPCFGTSKYLEVDYTCQCKYLITEENKYKKS
uniref:L-rhamnose-binding lectin CSL3-like n=1 Tax=Haplochromis burtoni TaxID=8153 RepID=A0A3Q2V141_HAPBU